MVQRAMVLVTKQQKFLHINSKFIVPYRLTLNSHFSWQTILDPKPSFLTDDTRRVQEITSKLMIHFRAESSLKSVIFNCMKFPLLFSSSVANTNSPVEYCLPGTSYQKHFGNYSNRVWCCVIFSLKNILNHLLVFCFHTNTKATCTSNGVKLKVEGKNPHFLYLTVLQ